MLEPFFRPRSYKNELSVSEPMLSRKTADWIITVPDHTARRRESRDKDVSKAVKKSLVRASSQGRLPKYNLKIVAPKRTSISSFGTDRRKQESFVRSARTSSSRKRSYEEFIKLPETDSIRSKSTSLRGTISTKRSDLRQTSSNIQLPGSHHTHEVSGSSCSALSSACSMMQSTQSRSSTGRDSLARSELSQVSLAQTHGQRPGNRSLQSNTFLSHSEEACPGVSTSIIYDSHSKVQNSFSRTISNMEELVQQALLLATQTIASVPEDSDPLPSTSRKSTILLVEPCMTKTNRLSHRKIRDVTPYPGTRQPSMVPSSDILQGHSEPANAPIKLNMNRKPSTNLKIPSKRLLRQEESRHCRNDGLRGQQRGPTIQPRSSSMKLRRNRIPRLDELNLPDGGSRDLECKQMVTTHHNSLHETAAHGCRHMPQQGLAAEAERNLVPNAPNQYTSMAHAEFSAQETANRPERNQNKVLQHRPTATRHTSIQDSHDFSFNRTHRRRPIARDWSQTRKRMTAFIACWTSAIIGTVIGIYAGEVPAIQYILADENHYAILGNVVLFVGLGITTLICWPLPLLHGRKVYTLLALSLTLALHLPQASAVNVPRSPTISMYRIGLLLPRALSGLAMGLANINSITALLDLFGASLQSGNPHQEALEEDDVRRHGDGMGVWLGLFAWSSVMTIGLGFLVGALIISNLNVSWGFWISIVLILVAIVLNLVVPETRRSTYRRSVTEVRTGTELSRRVARGEIKMHLDSTGPLYWYEEVFAGLRLCFRMIKQPGLFVLILYQGWVYAQIVMIISLLGALLSRDYQMRPRHVGLGVGIVPLGGLLAIPFQKASLFSRARHHKQRTDSMTFEKRVTWTSHLVRRSIFMILLPISGIAYTLCSNGSVNPGAPIFFAGLIAFFTNLAIAECIGLLMETFDTSDLQPGMTGRPRRVLPEDIRAKRTNYSCFPRVSAAIMLAQTLGFMLAATATGVSGIAVRRIGAQQATTVVASILMGLTICLIVVLWRWKVVQVVPLERYSTAFLSGPTNEWKPVIVGHPSGTTRRMNLLELGNMSRWTEIRRKNKLELNRMVDPDQRESLGSETI